VRTSQSADFFGFTVGDGVLAVPISSIYLSSPLAVPAFVIETLITCKDIRKIPTPFDKIIFIIFFLFYWNLPPSPYPLPQGEGFKTFGRGRRRCEAHRVLRGADVPRAMTKNTHNAFLPWMGRFRTFPYVMFWKKHFQ